MAVASYVYKKSRFCFFACDFEANDVEILWLKRRGGKPLLRRYCYRYLLNSIAVLSYPLLNKISSALSLLLFATAVFAALKILMLFY